jgi:SAM-dependent methyltransferase
MVVGNEPEGIKFTTQLKYNNLQIFLYAYYFIRSVTLRGPLATIRLLAAEHKNEKFFRIATASIKRSNTPAFYHYQGAPYVVLFRVLKNSFALTRDIRFVDIGSGKGRAIFVAEYCGYSNLCGIELDNGLTEDARINLQNYKLLRKNSKIRFVNTNALEFEYENEPAVYFLFNPFDETILEQVLRKIKRSTSAETWFIYLNPLHRHAFDNLRIRQVKEFKTGLYTEAIIYRI